MLRSPLFSKYDVLLVVFASKFVFPCGVFF